MAQMKSVTRTRKLSAIVVLLMVAAALWAPTPAFAAVRERVTHDYDADWGQVHTRCAGTVPASGNQQFLPGPVGTPTNDSPQGQPPFGSGSLQFTIGPNNQSKEENRNTRYGATLLTAFQEISYFTYVSSAVTDPTERLPAVYLVLEIDLDGNGTRDNSLIFDPSDQGDQPDVLPGRWQRWTAKDDGTEGIEGLWRFETGAGDLRSLETWQENNTKAQVVNPGGFGGVAMVAGCGDRWTGFEGSVDGVTIDVDADAGTVYDFEPRNPTQATELDCLPETSTGQSGTIHVITCTARDAQEQPVDEVQVDFEFIGANDPDGADTPFTPDATCATGNNGQCSIVHGGTSGSPSNDSGVTTYRAWIDEDAVTQEGAYEADRTEQRDEGGNGRGSRPEPDDTDVVQRVWSGSRLNCDPESVGVQRGSQHVITCVATSLSGSAAQGVNVDVEATGVNNPDGNTTFTSPDLTCTTGTDGSCSVVHGTSGSIPGGRGTTNDAGITTYRAWIDADGSNATSSGEVDATEGRDEAANRGTTAEPDHTDVVEANWGGSGGTQSPTPGATTCPSPTPTGSPSPSPSGSPSPTPSATPCPSPTPTQ
ncbi:MAG: hypothetical protein M3277_08365, partial [Actinomycetota bacterium]|nr:hypothetical protein [Actinomycetota bacterium]